MAPPDALVELAAPWASLYAGSAWLATGLVFLHLAGVVVGGGAALAADRATLRAMRADASARARLLEDLALTHRPVLLGLGLASASGVLLLAADLETYLGSRLYWAKMGLVLVLLGNGAALARAERSLRTLGAEAEPEHRAWRVLGRAAHASRALWLLTLLAGVAVLNTG